MAAQQGLQMLIRIGTTPGSAVATDTYTTVAGIRSDSFTRNRESVDVSNIDSAGAMEVLEQGGIKSVTVSGSGVFTDQPSHATIETAYAADALHNWEIVIPGLGNYRGKFEIQSLEFGADYNGAVTFSISLNSSGALTFTSA